MFGSNIFARGKEARSLIASEPSALGASFSLTRCGVEGSPGGSLFSKFALESMRAFANRSAGYFVSSIVSLPCTGRLVLRHVCIQFSFQFDRQCFCGGISRDLEL